MIWLLFAALASADDVARIDVAAQVPVLRSGGMRRMEGDVFQPSWDWPNRTWPRGGILVEGAVPGQSAEWLASTGVRAQPYVWKDDRLAATELKVNADVGVRSKSSQEDVDGGAEAGVGVELGRLLVRDLPDRTSLSPHLFVGMSFWRGSGDTHGGMKIRLEVAPTSFEYSARAEATDRVLGYSWYPGHVSVSVMPMVSFVRPPPFILGQRRDVKTPNQAGDGAAFIVGLFGGTGIAAVAAVPAVVSQDVAMAVLVPPAYLLGTAWAVRASSPGLNYGWAVLGAVAGTSAGALISVPISSATYSVVPVLVVVPISNVLGSLLVAKAHARRSQK